MTGGSKIWTVRGIPADLQAAVSAAAKAGRQTLGEWTAAALSSALSGESAGPAAPAAAPADGSSRRLDAIEARLAQLERALEGLDRRDEGAQFRVDGLEHRTEGLDARVATLAQRLDALDARGGVRVGRAASAMPAQTPAPTPELPEAPAGPFTRGIGSRKRLTAAGEEELQRLLAAGVEDAAIAARLGIHKRIVWARRLTESAD